MFYWLAASVLMVIFLILMQKISITLQSLFQTQPLRLVIRLAIWPGKRSLEYALGGDDLFQIPDFQPPFWPAYLLKHYRPTLYHVVRFSVIDSLIWKSTLGLGDAMQTALCSGILWSCKGSAISYISRLMSLKKVTLHVKPDFTSTDCSSSLDCIFKIRLVHYIYIMTMIWLRRRRTNHGRTTAGNAQPPNRGFNENRHAEY